MKLKSPNQIERIRESGAVLAQVLDSLSRMVEPGISLLDIDAECRRLIAAAGARPAFLGYMDYPAAICTSVNVQVIHGIPSRRKLKPGDVVSLDCGVDLDGFISDSATTVAVGRVDPKIRQLMRVTKEALELGIAAAHPGGRIHDISRAIFRHVSQHNYGCFF